MRQSASPISAPSASVPFASAAPHLSAYGRRVLDRLAKGRVARRREEGGYGLGGLTVPDSLAAELKRHDLVAETPARELVIAAPGEALVRRLEAGKPGGGRQAGPAGAGAAFAAQHQARRRRRVQEGRAAREVTVNMAESPLYWLRTRRQADGRPLIEAAQFEAGERLRETYEIAMRGPAVTMRWDAPPLGRTPRGAPRGLDPTMAQLNAKKRLHCALDAVGPELSDILIRVCCHHEGLEPAERALGWPRRSAKLVLSIALTRLAAHYRL